MKKLIFALLVLSNMAHAMDKKIILNVDFVDLKPKELNVVRLWAKGNSLHEVRCDDKTPNLIIHEGYPFSKVVQFESLADCREIRKAGFQMTKNSNDFVFNVMEIEIQNSKVTSVNIRNLTHDHW